MKVRIVLTALLTLLLSAATYSEASAHRGRCERYGRYHRTTYYHRSARIYPPVARVAPPHVHAAYAGYHRYPNGYRHAYHRHSHHRYAHSYGHHYGHGHYHR